MSFYRACKGAALLWALLCCRSANATLPDDAGSVAKVTDPVADDILTTPSVAANEESVLPGDPAEEQDLDKADKYYQKASELLHSDLTVHDEVYELMEKSAALGDDRAIHYLARAYLFADYEKYGLDVNKAHELAERCALLGNAECQGMLGFMHATGTGTTMDTAKAVLYYTFAAMGGDPYAHQALGDRYRTGENIRKNCAQAEMHYLAAAEAGLDDLELKANKPNDRVRLSDYDDDPEDKYRLLEKDQYTLLKYTADRGYVDAQVMLGQMNYMGVGTDVNLPRALEYFNQAANQGDATAKAYLAQMHAQGDGVPQDNSTAFKLYQEAADGGSAVGLNGLGFAYLRGIGVARDYAKALQYFTQAANMPIARSSNALGVVDAKFHLGSMYYNGQGVPSDYSKAYELFTSAAALGHSMAYYYLALMHHNGQGRARNCDMAVSYLKNVCDRGSHSDHVNEGFDAYADGDVARALVNYLYAAELGLEVAQSNAAHILDNLFAQHQPYALSDFPDWLTPEAADALAFIMHTRAAEQGNIASRIRVGDMYYYGRGVRQNFDAAAEEYRAAQKLNSPQAMFNLAYMHQWGIGFQQDFHLSKRYYDMAEETSAVSAKNTNDARLAVFLARVVLYPHWAFTILARVYRGEYNERLGLNNHEAMETIFLGLLILLLLVLLKVRQRYRLRQARDDVAE